MASKSEDSSFVFYRRNGNIYANFFEPAVMKAMSL